MLSVTNMVTNSNIITNVGSFVFFFFSLEVFVKSEKLKFEISQCCLNETFLSSITSFFCFYFGRRRWYRIMPLNSCLLPWNQKQPLYTAEKWRWENSPMRKEMPLYLTSLLDLGQNTLLLISEVRLNFQKNGPFWRCHTTKYQNLLLFFKNSSVFSKSFKSFHLFVKTQGFLATCGKLVMVIELSGVVGHRRNSFDTDQSVLAYSLWW